MPTITIYSNSGSGGVTTDGYVGRNGVDQTFANIRATSGNDSSVTDASQVCAQLQCSITTNQFQTLRRGIFTFDTSVIGVDATINSAVFSLFGNGHNSNIGTSGLYVAGAGPANSNNLVNADYQSVKRVAFGSISDFAWSNAGYNDFTLNSLGIASINPFGITKLSTQLGFDINNTTTGLTWLPGQDQQYFICYYSDQGGTTNIPKLVINYTNPVDDRKPNNNSVLDIKPDNGPILDTRPNNTISIPALTEQRYAMTLGKNQWTGFYNLTYPAAINVISSKSP